ncbi:flagellar motor protein MotB [Massilia eurypsychrophila]|jgi:outer membrane protein OmpA-like peptidoglycan-associated protein|uniref:Flagellar motor protein MotB n=1 Tax=Massilia eurypsychrophila TaxID=1485217 RepID=A0A2G8TD51_9BURK|nr:OmpA family protein [Massilia eurypsychrophila]PIL43960.1 flagellar motor protein MotB [Massilia eurypsychrophila]
MNAKFFKATILASAVMLAACSSTPTTTNMLDQARNEFVAANSNPAVSSYAPLEFKQASDALDAANAAAARRESLAQIDQLAYLAKQKIATAQQVASQKAAEADIANSGRQRDQLRLQARTAEADRAKMDADRAKMEAERAKMDAQSAQAQANDATRAAQNAEAQTREAQARAAQLEAQMADLQAKKTERGMIITIGDVLFATNQATLTADGVNNVRKLADVLNQNPNRTVLVEGFTDSTGTSAHNQELSERRAGSVASALTGMGIGRERVAMRGYGETYPVAGNVSAGDKQLNRRVEIVLSNEGVAIPPRR